MSLAWFFQETTIGLYHYIKDQFRQRWLSLVAFNHVSSTTTSGPCHSALSMPPGLSRSPDPAATCRPVCPIQCLPERFSSLSLTQHRMAWKIPEIFVELNSLLGQKLFCYVLIFYVVLASESMFWVQAVQIGFFFVTCLQSAHNSLGPL